MGKDYAQAKQPKEACRCRLGQARPGGGLAGGWPRQAAVLDAVVRRSRHGVLACAKACVRCGLEAAREELARSPAAQQEAKSTTGSSKDAKEGAGSGLREP